MKENQIQAKFILNYAWMKNISKSPVYQIIKTLVELVEPLGPKIGWWINYILKSDLCLVGACLEKHVT